MKKISNIRTICTSDHPCHLLAITEDVEVSRFLQERFSDRRLGITLIIRTTLKDALATIKTLVVEAVMLDLHLSGSDGLAAQTQIIEATKERCPVFVIAESYQLEDRALELKAHDFLIKPLHNFDLIGRVKYAILRQKAQNQLMDDCEDLKRRVAKIENAIQGSSVNEMIELKDKLAEMAAAASVS